VVVHRSLADLNSYKGLCYLQIFEAKEALRIKKNAMNHNALGDVCLGEGECEKAIKENQEAHR